MFTIMKLGSFCIFYACFCGIAFAYLLPQNIILVGMPNSGKSYLGAKLAYHLSIPHYDTDDYNPYMKEYKTTKKDWRCFREEEHKIVSHFLEIPDPKIISTGGGIIDNHQTFHRFLNRDPEQDLIIQVIRHYEPKETRKNLPDTMEKLWLKRGKFYLAITDAFYWNHRSPSDFLKWFEENIKHAVNKNSIKIKQSRITKSTLKLDGGTIL
jgi:shikimate kinase